VAGIKHHDALRIIKSEFHFRPIRRYGKTIHIVIVIHYYVLLAAHDTKYTKLHKINRNINEYNITQSSNKRKLIQYNIDLQAWA